MKSRVLQLGRVLGPTAIIAAIYFASAAVVFFAMQPVQMALVPNIGPFASLVFLPHGVRVLATVVLRWRAIPGLFLGALLSGSLVWGVSDPTLLLFLSLVSALTCSIVFEGLRALRINPYYLSSSAKVPPVHTILLAGILCSFASGFFTTAILETTHNAGHVTLTMAAIFTGDTVGFMVSWIAAFFGLKYFTELSG